MAVFGGGSPVSKLSKITPNAQVGKLMQWSLDARRAIILYRRLKAGQVDLPDAPWPFYVEPDAPVDKDIEKSRETLKEARKYKERVLDPNTRTVRIIDPSEAVEDYISIIDIDYGGVYGKGIREIKLPFIPKEVEYNSESTFVAIKPVGRNNPGYHYTGAEDKIEFEIDWHSMDNSRTDVINKCRMIEALTKADGYSGPPHRVCLHWGEQNKLFRDHIFVVLSAPYRLTQFNKAQLNAKGNIERTAMLPIQAYQKVTLARVTSDNLTFNQIESSII